MLVIECWMEIFLCKMQIVKTPKLSLGHLMEQYSPRAISLSVALGSTPGGIVSLGVRVMCILLLIYLLLHVSSNIYVSDK